MDDSAITSPLVLLLAGLLIFGTSSALVLMADNSAPADRLDESVDPGHEKISRSIFTTLVRPLGSAWVPPGEGQNGQWSGVEGAGDVGLSKSPGVLDSAKLDALGGLDYNTVKNDLLGLKPSQHFHLLVNEVNDLTTPLWSFGEARPSQASSTPTAAQFCLDACDHIVLVRLFVFDGVPGPQQVTVQAPLSDLTILALTTDPLAPIEGQFVTITATVQNGGDASTAARPISVQFKAGSADIGLGQVAGPLATNGLTQVSITWVAPAAGSYQIDAKVNPAHSIKEKKYDNNDAGPIAVTVVTAVPVESWGSAFRDANGDGEFTVGIDTPVLDNDLANCQYDAGSEGLVIPEGAADISAESCSLKAGLNLFIGVSLTATAGDIELEGQSIEVAPGTELKASGTIQFGFPNGHLPDEISVAGAKLDAQEAIEMTWKEGALDATGATMKSCGAITIGGGNKGAKEAGSATLSNATLDNTCGTSSITIQNVDGAILAAGASTLIKSKGAISVSSDGAVDLSNATADASGGTSAITVTGKSVKLYASKLIGSTAATAIQVTSSGGAISASKVVATAKGNHVWSATGGGIDFTNGELKAEGKILTASVVKNAGYKVTITGATFADSNNKLKVNPNNTATYVTGTPASGGTE